MTLLRKGFPPLEVGDRVAVWQEAPGFPPDPTKRTFKVVTVAEIGVGMFCSTEEGHWARRYPNSCIILYTKTDPLNIIPVDDIMWDAFWADHRKKYPPKPYPPINNTDLSDPQDS